MGTIETKALSIGRVKLSNNLIMAPMAGITDLPFRALVRAGGAGLVCAEMVSARALTYRDPKTLRILTLGEDEHPISVQIFGSDPLIMAEGARIVEAQGADIVDINFGCPVHKVMKAGAGAKLADDEKRMARIMEAVAAAVKIPATAKIRIGRVPGENAAPRIARTAEDAGIAMVAVHGRPASAGHGGKVDRAAIAETVAACRIPVVGNGGITDELSARDFLKETNCAGLMLGRAAIGDPGIFRRIESFLSTGIRPDEPTWEARLAALKEHATRAAAYYGERHGIIQLRKVAPFYLKGLPNASRIRSAINGIDSLVALSRLLETVWQSPYFGETATEEAS